MPIGPYPLYPRMQSLVMVPSPTAFGAGAAYQPVYTQPAPVTVMPPPPPPQLTEEELKQVSLSAEGYF